MYVCICVSLTQILLTQIATLYNNGFSVPCAKIIMCIRVSKVNFQGSFRLPPMLSIFLVIMHCCFLSVGPEDLMYINHLPHDHYDLVSGYKIQFNSVFKTVFLGGGE